MSVPTPRLLHFRGLEITYDHRVLEPRPWTQAQSEWAEDLLAHAAPGAVLELCAGAGQIGLGAVRDVDRRLVQVDADPVAADFARANAAANGMADRVEVRQAPMEDAVAPGERFPLILADPPWVRSADISAFPADPLTAIDGGGDGLDLARTCVRVIEAHLVSGGSALLQLGGRPQVDAVTEHLRRPGAAGLMAREVREYAGGVVVRLDWVGSPAQA